jgi:ParB-like partition proteins
METRKLSELKANPLNPRGEVVHDVALRELAASIKSQGLLQPILITPDGTIVAGHRRVVAARLAGFIDVAVIVRDLNETAQLQVMLVENIQRNDLTILQTAKAYKELIQRGLSIELIAQVIGVTKRSVSEHLMIFKLPAEVREQIDKGAMGLRAIPALLELSPTEQIDMAQTAVEKGWGFIKIRSAIYRMRTPRPDVEIVPALLDRVYERIENGYFLLEEIMTCGECGHSIFSLTEEEVKKHLDKLIDMGRIEIRKQGGRKEFQRGDVPDMYVPCDMPTGEIDFSDDRRLAAGNEYAR